MSDWHPTACILCSRNCGLLVQIEDGHLTKIRGDQNHPVSAGYMCQKAAQLDHYQNNADRLTQPLKRQEDGSYQPIDWQTAITEISNRLLDLKQTYGKECLAFYGGGGQGNHLGSMYSSTFRDALEIPYYYSALAQEKTGDFWVNGKLFGRQNCHTTEDIEQADCVLFIGTNPWQAHGIRNARPTLKQLANNAQRTMIVIDPRCTETAELADIHLQLRPGTDAFLLSAMLAILVQEGWEDQACLKEHTVGFAEVRACLQTIPIDDYIDHAGVEAKQVYEAVRRFAAAKSATVRVDLGLQQSLNSTLNSYLEKLLFLLTGNLGKPGGNNFHTFFLPWVGHSDVHAKPLRKTMATGITEIAQLFPPNVLPAEIESDHPQRLRGLIVDSANPVVSGADTQAYQRAFTQLDLLVVVDVAMSETARFADYILPAASQFEKWEAAFFNLEFPTNAFHLRKPLFKPLANTLPESEIYRRLAVSIGAIPERYPLLERVARWHWRWPQLSLYRLALVAAMTLQPKLRRTVAFALQGSLGKTLPDESIAPFWGVSQLYVQQHGEAVARTGLPGRGGKLAEALFQRLLQGSGTTISQHLYEDTWSLMGYKDQKVRLAIPELLETLQTLESATSWPDYPLMLIAGERRMYNANTIYRDPQWRQSDAEGVLKIHPTDAITLELADGNEALCQSPWGELTVHVKLCDTLRPGVVSLPHGYGLDYPDSQGQRIRYGPLLNVLTGARHCDPISATPFHKNVPVRLQPLRRKG
ncbi:molybdopterin-dependent oxidoreductase [Acaryochloris sp. IP29b_bin.148]|uniref:molybdopterin-dependent oxidoreductase n=1 Tax=Acaryochloris sp. IP29b_bin.148 TaxID=2969218 RepID=UPI002601E3A6|nr:molybdopterin-dependent oxidoreductase [Acaryochloris sp. IP29b_bin.148]